MPDTELIRQTEVQGELTVEQLVGQMDKLRDVMRRAMKEGEDYGAIPGTGGNKKPLLQPGAEKLAMMFRFAPSYKIVQVDLAGGHREFTVTCTLTHIPTGNFCGEATAFCSSLEPKYRYRGGSLACPECGKSAIIKGKAEYGGGWVCFKKKGGCGAKFPDDHFSMSALEKIENPDIAAEFNTIVQMAQKRAFLRAIRQATAASELFTQDIDEQQEPTANDIGPRPEDIHDSYSAPPARKPAKPKAEPGCHDYEVLTKFLRECGCKNPEQATALVRFAGGDFKIEDLRDKPLDCCRIQTALEGMSDKGTLLARALSTALNETIAS